MTTLQTLITVTLAVGRWAVAAPGDVWAEVDLPLHRDPRSGEVHLPCTGLAGALRDHLTRAGDTEFAKKWLGQTAPEQAETRDRAVAYAPGRLWILGARVTTGAPSRRGRTAIDDRRSAARETTLRTEEFVSPGVISVAIEHEGGPDQRLLELLAHWAPFVGRGRSGGLGVSRVSHLDVHALDLSHSGHLTWWLSDHGSWPTVAPPPDARHDVSLPGATKPTPDFAWVVREPIHIGVTGTAAPGKAAPTLTAGGRALIPGESWKGVFRHRCGAILRFCGATAVETQQVQTALFGSLETGRGLLAFHDTYCPPGRTLRTQSHVAIDRFTGGAADGLLFATEAIPRGTWLDLSMTPSLTYLPPAVANLLGHVARDMHDGLIGIGGGGGRGYGWLQFKGEPQDVEPVLVGELLQQLGSLTEVPA